MTSEKIWVGIDVCKDMLDIYLLPQKESLQLPKTETGVQKLVEQLQPLAPSLVVAESTGGLERLLVNSLQATDQRSCFASITQRVYMDLYGYFHLA